jgi:hypothetical protein
MVCPDTTRNEPHAPRKYRLGSFLPEYMEPKPGRFVAVEDGRVLGEHGNAMFLTVGQGAKVRTCIGQQAHGHRSSLPIDRPIHMYTPRSAA